MIKRNIHKLFFGIPASLVLAGILFSCVNDLAQVRIVGNDPKSPDEVTADLELFYTDSGAPKVRIYAKLAETYSLPEKVTKLKDGIKVDFYDETGEIVSTLTALYGEVQLSKNLMFVRDSVELYNYAKKQRMETEELFWNQKDSLIYTDKNVIVRSPDGVVYGKGIRTKQDFSTFTFYKPTGTINATK